MSALDWLLDNDPAKCDEMLCMEIYCSVSDDFVHCTILMSTKEVSHKQAQVGPVPIYIVMFTCVYICICVNDASNAEHRPPLHCTATLVAAAGLAQVASNANLSTSPISNPGNKTSIWEKPNIWSFLRRFFSAGVNHKG